MQTLSLKWLFSDVMETFPDAFGLAEAWQELKGEI